MGATDPAIVFKFDGVLGCEDFRDRVLRHNLDSAGTIVIRTTTSRSLSLSVPLAGEPDFDVASTKSKISDIALKYDSTINSEDSQPRDERNRKLRHNRKERKVGRLLSMVPEQ